MVETSTQTTILVNCSCHAESRRFISSFLSLSSSLCTLLLKFRKVLLGSSTWLLTKEKWSNWGFVEKLKKSRNFRFWREWMLDWSIDKVVTQKCGLSMIRACVRAFLFGNKILNTSYLWSCTKDQLVCIFGPFSLCPAWSLQIAQNQKRKKVASNSKNFFLHFKVFILRVRTHLTKEH